MRNVVVNRHPSHMMFLSENIILFVNGCSATFIMWLSVVYVPPSDI